MTTDDTTQQLPTSGDEPQQSPTGATAEIPGLFPESSAPTSPGPAPAGTAPSAWSGAPVDAPATSPERPRLRVSTAVWGLVIAAIGVGVVALAAGAVFDLQLALIAVLAVAGAAMLGGSIAAAARHRGP
ncbi:hypothetical protein DDP54_04205 [Cellulomonas sp. WB94]|uniref:hypothetical protein n=1 Tax=Cellulomonas sp. WB94 TaxID=2173174 RepID=UPI000D56B36E|nr:hypothetical protein [Cellulomonas sp. WB94]PVU82328.1 hypothetical protein DDP54_04205 [Cellulomonas sp. WB94]